MDEDFILTEFVLKEPNNIQPNYVQLYVNGELVTSDLQSDAYEAYVKCENIPEDATKTNTFESEEMLTSFKKGYKYILYNGEYYSWHQIHFSVDDEIHIVTKRINRYKNTGGFILKGYNRFINYPIYVETPEASIDEEKLVFETTNITITPSEECII
jgi:hypothetical protein